MMEEGKDDEVLSDDDDLELMDIESVKDAVPRIVESFDDLDEDPKRRHIVVALDGSDHSVKALNEAISYARDEDIIILAHALESFGSTSLALMANGFNTVSIPDPSMFKKANRYFIRKAVSFIQYAYSKIRSSGRMIHVTHALLAPVDGVSHKENLCDFVNEGKYNVIFVGSRGLGAFKSFWLGSVSDYIVKHTTCNVMIVK